MSNGTLPAKYSSNVLDTYGEPLEPVEDKGLFDKDLDDAQKRSMMQNLMLSGGLQAVQAGVAAIPTAQDRRNKEELARLQKLFDEGKAGLTDAEIAEMERLMLTPGRALSTEQRQRMEAQLASAEQRSSAADLQRVEKQAQQQVQEAAFKAGAQISAANLQRAQEQLRELEQRIAYKAERQKGRREAFVGALGEAGKVLGQTMATQAVPTLDLSEIPEGSQDLARELIMEAVSERDPIERQRQLDTLGNLIGATVSRTSTR